VFEGLKHKVDQAVYDNESLFYIGFQLPDFRLSDLSISKEFTNRVYFSHSQFFRKVYFSEGNLQEKVDFYKVRYFGEANFFKVEFSNEVQFPRAKFSTEVNFSGYFNGKTEFNYVLFEGKEKVIFDTENISLTFLS